MLAVQRFCWKFRALKTLKNTWRLTDSVSEKAYHQINLVSYFIVGFEKKTEEFLCEVALNPWNSQDIAQAYWYTCVTVSKITNLGIGADLYLSNW